MENLINFNLFNNNGMDYLYAIAAIIASYIVLKIIQTIVIARLEKLSKKTATGFDDALINAVNKIKNFSYAIASVYIGATFLNLPSWLDKGLRIVFLAIVVYEVVQIVQRVINFFTLQALIKSSDESQAKSTVKTLNVFIQIILWSLGVILILSNAGVNITSLLAGLGIGGIAIALALQNILSDVFSSFSILIDKPFKVGDFIKIGSDMGVVEKIGIKTSRLKTLDGQVLIVSNQELTKVRVENFYNLKRRRALFTLGVIYETSREKLEKIPQIIKDIVNSQEFCELDRCHFKSFGDFSLNYEVSIYIDAKEYGAYMDVLQVINLEIFSRFEKEGISFAYPTQMEYHKAID